MHSLLIDTADPRGCLALLDGAHVATVEEHPADADYSSWLLPAAKRVLAAKSLNLADLDGYAVCSGPGSFTGLRVGLTTVKAWAEIYPKPIVAVSRVEALAASRERPGSSFPGFTAVFLDARRNQVFAALYDSCANAVESETVIPIGHFLQRVDQLCGNRPVLWRTPDPDILQIAPEWEERRNDGDILEIVKPPFAAQLAAAAHGKFLDGQVTDALSLDANYVRRSDAELFWKDHASSVKA